MTDSKNTSSLCKRCHAPLTRDEVSLTKKLVDRRAHEFLCIPCLARSFEMTEEECHALILRFREERCPLFL
ncbi:MAG: hypothetical protein J6S76_04495 [Clostridia bacterium]|nr:hypothetical protein [Clostridia bacterium]